MRQCLAQKGELKTLKFYIIAVVVVIVSQTVPVAADGNSQVKPFETSRLSIEATKGPIAFSVEMAVSRAQRQMGLQWRTRLGAKHGMLFDFTTPQPVAMWMKNTIIPLDMIFIANDGRIASIVRNTTPMSLAIIRSVRAVRAVLEVNAGTADAMGIRRGDRVMHDIFVANGAVK